MHLDSYQKILETTAWEPDDDGVENSRDAAINFMSASARFTKKPFLRQVDIAKRMAREKVFRMILLIIAHNIEFLQKLLRLTCPWDWCQETLRR